jgi:hypothetical protein
MRIPDEIAALAKHVNLETIRLIHSSAEWLPVKDGKAEEFDIDIETGGGTPNTTYPQGFACAILVRFRMHGHGSKDTVAMAEGRWLMLYAVADETVRTGISEHLAAAFATFNATINLWPHAREFLLNTSWRMGLPPVVLPTFRFEMFDGFLDGGLRSLDLHRQTLGTPPPSAAK